MKPNKLKNSPLFFHNGNRERSIQCCSADKARHCRRRKTIVLIIRFLLDKSPHAKAADGPGIGWKARTKCQTPVQKNNKQLDRACFGSGAGRRPATVHPASADSHVQVPRCTGGVEKRT